MLRLNGKRLLPLMFFGLAAISTAHAEVPLGLDIFPLSQEISSLERKEPDYRLMLGGIIKINGLVRSDREQRLNAGLMRTTWQLPSGYSPEDGFNFFRKQLLDRQANVLFECAGRQCGPSSLWANEVFGQARLYGVDNSQWYAAFELEQGHVALYAVRRGNGRVYVHMDLLSDDSLAVTDLAERVRQQGYAELTDWPHSRDKVVKSLLDLLAAFPERSLLLVLHWQSRDLDLSLRQSQEAADRLKRSLVEEGIDPVRIEAKGVGALVPSVLGSRSSVAVVVLRPE